MNKSASVLFVCLGNICRSPLAEGAFRKAVLDAGLEVHVDSAGTSDWHIGKVPDPRAQAVAKKYGVDISGFQARQLDPLDYKRFTHILALDNQNLADIRSKAPLDTTAEISLLLDYVEGREGTEVADPYYGEDEGFEVTWNDVTIAAQALLERFRP